MISKSVEETAQAAREFAAKVRPHASRAAQATVIALSGDLGSGKTTFTKAFASALGVPAEEITSPTFVIMKFFLIRKSEHYKKLIHIDAYRLERAEEIEGLGWHDLLSDPSNLILIEWPENIGDALPKDAQKITFKFVNGNTREIICK